MNSRTRSYSGTIPLAMDLILSLGLFFLIVNLLVEFSFPLIDPCLRMEPQVGDQGRCADMAQQVGGPARDVVRLVRRDPGALQTSRNTLAPPVGTAAQPARPATGPRPSSPAWLRIQSSLRNPMFIASAVAMLLLAALALFGGKLNNVNPYQVHGVTAINGKYTAPPFRPSAAFPWGTDQLGA